MLDFHELHNNAHVASTLLKAMSNERRLRILCRLADGECSVSELEEAIDLSQSALSQHLARLRQDDIVKARRSAQMVYYSLNSEAALTIMASLHAVYCAPAQPAEASQQAHSATVRELATAR